MGACASVPAGDASKPAEQAPNAVVTTMPAAMPAAPAAAPVKPAAAAVAPVAVPAKPTAAMTIIFVLGGPGSGKGTQCERIVRDYGFKHLSSGDLLRDEVASGSALGKEIDVMMKEGKLVPMDITIKLLKAAMDASANKKFLIDGFPRALDQATLFESAIAPCNFVLFIDCPLETMQARLLKRAETSGRADDNIETIKKRFDTFTGQSMPVVEHYKAQGKSFSVSSTEPPDVVYTKVQDIIDAQLNLPKKAAPAPTPAPAAMEAPKPVEAPMAAPVAAPMEAPPAPEPEPPAPVAPPAEAPMAEAPMAEAPMAEAPMAEAPMAEAPMAEAPMAVAPMAVAPPAEAPMPAADDSAMLLPQPAEPVGKIVVIECRGGSDKGPDGHRKDTIPICNELIKKGWAAEPIFYSDAEHDEVYATVKTCKGYIGRVNPGGYEGVTQSKLDALMRTLASEGVKAMAHPDTMIKMGAKDALQKIKDLSCGMPDTYAYYTIESFKESFPKTIATGIRVLKQNRGSQGEGIWVCKIKEGQEGDVTDATVLHLTEAVDNHVEEMPIAEFMTFCEKYIVGDQGQLIDQRFLPRIVEGEIRVNMIYDTPTELVHKKPAAGGISATLKSGATYISFKPDDPQFAVLMEQFIKADLPKIMPALGLEGEPYPLIWTTDFILGEKTAEGNDTYFVGEFNCSCVGITQQLYLAEKVADAAISICK